MRLPLPAAPAVTAVPELPAAPRWLPGGHAQTIWPALYARPHGGARPRWRRERWTTPDADFIDADWLLPDRDTAPPPAGAAPLLVLFHGLEGSSASHYALAFADWARRHGWGMVVPHFRGCSGSINLAPRAYHSGDHVEIGWMLDQIAQRHTGPRVAVGVSMGGNALMCWAAEAGDAATRQVQAVAAVCSPLDLGAAGHAIGQGVNGRIYTPMFLRTMKPKALTKLAQFPGLFDARRLQAARNLHEFDNLFTAPLHGYRDADDYWHRAAALPRLGAIRLPALLINPRNDPFVPSTSFDGVTGLPPHLHWWRPAHGGHVGFASGRLPGHLHALPRAVMGWMRPHAGL